ncbi:hypothetical protein [Micromonospora humi]|uniref:Oligosaccharide repeat unit polymerase n=1 Tax=Micromonospora humi TaxID=745366 RepID=A0A1C5K7P9_9ACTN|nr:hypothetical protein [Micromonospora humi]SCG78681.1 hypothetical protein GA0070213_12235 [Micromonospora humi]
MSTRSRDGLTAWAFTAVPLVVLTTMLVSFDPRLRHWYVVPVTASGILVGVDAVRCLRGETDKFDPQALVGFFGVHFFYAAPLLHVVWDYWAPYVAPPPDWRAALGIMAVLNTVGLMIYRVVLHQPTRVTPWSARQRQVDRSLFVLVGSVAIMISLGAFALILAKFGGFSGYLATMADRYNLTDRTRGLGWLVIIGESFPPLIFAVVVVRWREWLAAHPRWAYLLLTVLVVMQVAAGGARGARSNTIWPVLLGLIMLHLVVVRVSRRALLTCLLVFGLFMYVGGLYKDAGADMLGLFKGQRTTQDLEDETGRDLPTMVLADLGRSDVQALALHRQREGYAPSGNGITYLGDVAFLVPPRILPAEARPPSKSVVGTDMLYGSGAWASGQRSSRIFGLTGEAILNFGYLGGIASFLVLGLAVRWMRRCYRRAQQNQDLLPKLVTPALCVGLILFHGSDLDNVTWYLAKQVLPLMLVLWLALRTRPQAPALTPLPPPDRLGVR